MQLTGDSVGRDSSPVQKEARISTGLETHATWIDLAQHDKSLVALIDTPELSAMVIPLLSRYDNDVVADDLLKRLSDLQSQENSAAMQVLCGRVAWSNLVLDRIVDGSLPKSQLTAFFAQQMSNLSDSKLNERLTIEWGTTSQSSAGLKTEISKTSSAYKAAPLWAFSDGEGAAHFKKLCASCHLPDQQTAALAPKLAGSGPKGIDYFVENVIDPNAVIGRDFQTRIIVTTEDRIITGQIQKETDLSITVRTLTESVTVAKSEIEETKISPSSFMPEGLLKTLNDRERIELFKFLIGQ